MLYSPNAEYVRSVGEIIWTNVKFYSEKKYFLSPVGYFAAWNSASDRAVAESADSDWPSWDSWCPSGWAGFAPFDWLDYLQIRRVGRGNRLAGSDWAGCQRAGWRNRLGSPGCNNFEVGL